jgi:GT2 family glycosyltransferase
MARGGGDRSSWCYPRSMLSSRFQEFEASRFVGAGHAIRRSALARTKGYDEALFFYWEELDLSYQLIEAGYRIVYDPSVIVRHKSSPEARLWWERGRFYYRARNRIYLTHKHFRRPILTVGVAMGYMALALRNRTLDQWAAGVTGALSMIRRAGWRSRPGLSREARRRIQGCAGPRAASFLNQFRTRLVSRPAPGR